MKITVDFTFPDKYDQIPDELIFGNITKLFPIQCTGLKVIRRITNNQITYDFIEKSFCHAFGFEPDQLKIKTRKGEIKEGRQILHYLAKHFNLGSYDEIGKRFGDKDHATVMYSCRTVSDLLQTDKQFQNKYGDFIKSFM